MKKHILTFFMVALSAASFATAQINIDWSVDAVIKPTQLNSTQSGTAVPIEVVLKNNGPDSALIGDSIFFSVGVAINSTLLIYYPSANLSSLAFGYTLQKNLKSGDTMHFVGQVNSTYNVYPSTNANFIFTSILLNRARGLGNEQTATLTNNSKTVQVVWYNIQGWPVSVKENNITSLASIYPNTNSGKFSISLSAANVNETTQVDIYSLVGVKVKSFTMAKGETELQADCSELSTGTYIVKTLNGQLESSNKVVIQ